ncbi:hypothetical protein J2T17_007524 [Paenibacillus mucilaginosus]
MYKLGSSLYCLSSLSISVARVFIKVLLPFQPTYTSSTHTGNAPGERSKHFTGGGHYVMLTALRNRLVVVTDSPFMKIMNSALRT